MNAVRRKEEMGEGRGRGGGREVKGDRGKRGVREGEGGRLEYATPECFSTALQSQHITETLVHAMHIIVLSTVAKF